MLLPDGEHHFRAGAEARPEFDRPPFEPFPLPPPEERIVPLTSVRDLDLQAFERFFRSRRAPTEEEPRRATEEDLLDFGLLADSGGERSPTLYGILGFGRTPQIHPRTTSFLIRCAAYAGEDRGREVILAGVADGRLDEQVPRALGWFRSLGWREKYEGLLREDLPRLPPKALREALANAVAHRTTGSAGPPSCSMSSPTAPRSPAPEPWPTTGPSSPSAPAAPREPGTRRSHTSSPRPA